MQSPIDGLAVRTKKSLLALRPSCLTSSSQSQCPSSPVRQSEHVMGEGSNIKDEGLDAGRPLLRPGDADPYVEAEHIQVPELVRREFSSSRIQQPLAEGTELEYFSKTKGCWLPAIVTTVDGDNGRIILDCKPNSWIVLKTHGSLLRARITPSKDKMLQVLDIFYSGTLPEKVLPLFQRHCRQTGVAATHPRSSEEGLECEAVLLEDIPGLAADLDDFLGITCSISNLRAHFSPTRPELRLDSFQAICWTLLWQLKSKYCHFLARKETLQRSLRNVSDVLDLGETLGRGTFGSVFLATDRKSGEQRAVKRIQKNVSGSEDDMQQHRQALAQEIEHLQILDHPHVLRLYEHFEDGSHWYLVTEFCSGGTLSKVLLEVRYQSRKLPIPFIAEVMGQILSGIAHVHSRGLLHLDIKGDNIMMLPSSSGTVLPGSEANEGTDPTTEEILQRPHAVIIDLGVSQVFKPGDFHTDRPYGTPAFMAPEVWLGTITPQADIFSLGVVLFELFSHRLPYQISEEREEALAFWDKKISAPWDELYHVSPDGARLGKLMLQHDRRRRPTAKKCLRHQFFSPPQEDTIMQTIGGGLQRLPTFAVADIDIDDAPTLPSHYAERLANYTDRCMFSQAVRVKLARTWSPNCMPSIKRLFTLLDVGGLGRLDLRVLCVALEKSGIPQKRARKAVHGMIWSADGFVGWTEFVAAVVDLGENRFVPYLRRLFEDADKDRDGLLSSQDLACILHLDPEEHAQIAKQALADLVGSDKAGARADWQMFLKCFQTQPGEADPDAKAEPLIAEEDLPARAQQSEKLHNPTLLEQVGSMFDWIIQSPAEKADEDKLDQLAEMGFHDRKRCAVALQRHRNTITDSLVQELI
eukprot:TRINITY_DN701_c0_g2_i1.p1 TRINITY_DN701_c0_g2~~TRINITY_DN701_c0_g2_i1.p1  ORF type:complete len:866 (+),score=143.08 TRINITY_DN701_c0_g2_i1:47-2644(+)